MRIREHLPGLGVDALRTIGYSARSADGWRGPIRSTWTEARADAREHNHPGEHA